MIKNMYFIIAIISMLMSSCNQEDTKTLSPDNSTTQRIINLNIQTNSDQTIILPTQTRAQSSALTEGTLALYVYDKDYKFVSMLTSALPLSSSSVKLEIDENTAYNIAVLSFPKSITPPTPAVGDTPANMGYVKVNFYESNANNNIFTSGSTDQWGCLPLAAKQNSINVSLSKRFAQIAVPSGITKLKLTNKRHTVSMTDISPLDAASWKDVLAEQIIDIPAEQKVYISPDLLWGPTATEREASQSLTMEAFDGTAYHPVMYVGTSLSIRGGHQYKIAKSGDAYSIGVAISGDILRLGNLNIKSRAYADFKAYFPYHNCDAVGFSEMHQAFTDAITADGYKGWHSATYQSGYGAFMKNADYKGTAPNSTGALYKWGKVNIGIIAYHGHYFPYGPYQMNNIEYKGYKGTTDPKELIDTNKNQEKRVTHQTAMFADEQWLIAQGADVVIIMGDFNEPAASDYTPELVAKGFKSLAVAWPLTSLLTDKGYTDAYRIAKPDVIRYPGNTWSPLPGDEPYGIHDRIDFIWYKATSKRIAGISTLYAQTIGNDNMGDISVQGWPYDHAGLVVALEINSAE